MKEKIKTYLADFSLVLVALTWGLTFLPVQKVVDENPVYLFLFWRFLTATLLMAFMSIKYLKNASMDDMKGGTILGIFLFLGFAFQTFGLNYTYSSTVAFITGLNVLMVPIFAYFLFKTKPSIYSNIGAVIAAIGLYFLSASEIGFGKGEWLSFVCAVMFAAQVVLTAYYVKKCNIFVLVTFEFLAVSLLSLISSIIFDGQIKPTILNQTFIFAITITAVFATVFAFFVQTAVQKFTTPVKTAIIFTLEPVSAGIAGYLFADEILNYWQFFGVFLILFGVLFAEIGKVMKEKILSFMT